MGCFRLKLKFLCFQKCCELLGGMCFPSPQHGLSQNKASKEMCPLLGLYLVCSGWTLPSSVTHLWAKGACPP